MCMWGACMYTKPNVCRSLGLSLGDALLLPKDPKHKIATNLLSCSLSCLECAAHVTFLIWCLCASINNLLCVCYVILCQPIITVEDLAPERSWAEDASKGNCSCWRSLVGRSFFCILANSKLSGLIHCSNPHSWSHTTIYFSYAIRELAASSWFLQTPHLQFHTFCFNLMDNLVQY